MNHQHSRCEHKMAWCRDCDVAYCSKCSKEWGKNQWMYKGWTNATQTFPQFPYVYYSSGTTSGDKPLDVTPTITCNGSHTHG